jgi:hypothetical protein
MTEIKQMIDRLYAIECEYEEKENYNEQSIRVGQRIRALLNIYAQIIYEDRVFEEDYLKGYLER